MVETIFDVANLMGGMWFWYFFFIIIIGVWANSKNRNGLAWAVSALLFSPLIVGIILLFVGKLEKKEKKEEVACTKCGVNVSESDDFCPKCGVKVKEEGIKCSECKTINKESNKYCSKCGHKIIEEPESEYNCKYCDKKFTSENILQEHYGCCESKKEKAEQNKKLFIWIVGLLLFSAFGNYFFYNNRINLIPLFLIGFIFIPLSKKVFAICKAKSRKLKGFGFGWREKSVLIIGIILLFVLINLIIPECPKSCDDDKLCTNDFCSDETGFKCMNTVKLNCDGNGICETGEYDKSSDCPNCDDGNKCTADSYDGTSKQCIHTEMKGCI